MQKRAKLPSAFRALAALAAVFAAVTGGPDFGAAAEGAAHSVASTVSSGAVRVVADAANKPHRCPEDRRLSLTAELSAGATLQFGAYRAASSIQVRLERTGRTPTLLNGLKKLP